MLDNPVSRGSAGADVRAEAIVAALSRKERVRFIFVADQSGRRSVLDLDTVDLRDGVSSRPTEYPIETPKTEDAF